MAAATQWIYQKNLLRVIRGIATNAMEHPEKLKEMKEIWDEDWDDLLDGVSIDDNE